MLYLRKILIIIFFSFFYGSNSYSGVWGEGDLKLSNFTVDVFIEYIRGKGFQAPGIFYVTTDGDGMFYWYCPDGMGNCQSGSYRVMKEQCEQYWKKECQPFARQRVIKWKNGINPGKGKISKISSRSTDAEIRSQLKELGFLN